MPSVAARHGTRLLDYCVLPNHMHLLIRTSEAPISRKPEKGSKTETTQRSADRTHRSLTSLY
jgi:REP element-mobilizing transposase RayT